MIVAPVPSLNVKRSPLANSPMPAALMVAVACVDAVPAVATEPAELVDCVLSRAMATLPVMLV